MNTFAADVRTGDMVARRYLLHSILSSVFDRIYTLGKLDPDLEAWFED
jgi:hypothetical protein